MYKWQQTKIADGFVCHGELAGVNLRGGNKFYILAVEHGKRFWSPSFQPQGRARGKALKKQYLEAFSVSRRRQGIEYSYHEKVESGHHRIETRQIWDVTFNEDASRIRLGDGAENLGLLRRLSVNHLKREPSKMSLKMKRYKAGLNNDFMVKILAASAVD